MRHVKVKVCGLSEREHVLAAVEAGADYIGFVFAESRRRVAPEQVERIREVLDALPRRPLVVGVFVNEPPQAVNAVARRCRLDLVQLSGDEPDRYLAEMTHPVMKTIRVYPGTAARDLETRIASLRTLAGCPPLSFLLDTGSDGLAGGTGRVFDWRVARKVSAAHPVMVAGGLRPDTVGELIARVRPFGVDVSSGVERGGAKDSSLIRAFVETVRMAEQEMNDAGDTASR